MKQMSKIQAAKEALETGKVVTYLNYKGQRCTMVAIKTPPKV